MLGILLQEKQSELVSFAELKSQDEESESGSREALSQLHLSALTTRVAILTSEITSARSEMANQTELANKTLQKNEELKKQTAAVTAQNAKLKTRHLTQVSSNSMVLSRLDYYVT